MCGASCEILRGQAKCASQHGHKRTVRRTQIVPKTLELQPVKSLGLLRVPGKKFAGVG